MIMKDRILLFVKVPPPVTGATLMNHRVCRSALLRDTFHIQSIEISYTDSLNRMGKLSLTKALKVFKVIGRLLSELKAFRPSLVYFQISPHGIAFLRDCVYAVIMKLFRVSIVYHLRGKGISGKGKLMKLLYKGIFEKEYIICLSKLLAYDVQEVYMGRIRFVPNGNEDYYRGKQVGVRNRMGICRILFLSNICQSKGIFDFIHVISRLISEKVTFHAWIVGAENRVTKSDLIEKIRDMNLAGSVEYLGPLYDKDKHEVLRQSDILVYPTHEDAFPNVLIEATMHGIPVVAYNEGAIPDMIENGVNGFVVPKSDVEQLVLRTRELLFNRELRYDMGRKSRQKYESRFTLSHFEENMKNTFLEILQDIEISEDKRHNV